MLADPHLPPSQLLHRAIHQLLLIITFLHFSFSQLVMREKDNLT